MKELTSIIITRQELMELIINKYCINKSKITSTTLSSTGLKINVTK